jgi:hypothetical protein
MRTRAALLSLVLFAAGSAAMAQRRAPGRAPAGRTPAPAASPDTSAAPTPTPAAEAAASPAAAGGAGGTAAPGAPASFDLPLRQVGSGAISHFPLLEQLARNDVPVFVQVRSSAPIDHVSLWYRSQGATRYREVRMTAMGHNLQLPNGYGAQVPCEDAFPPAVEYYVQAIDTSGAAVGVAGTAEAPVSVPIVRERRHAFEPTLPGQAAPRSCGTLTTVATPAPGRGPGGSGGTAAPAEEVRGTADLGEPCRRDLDCISSRLRCGSNHLCVLRAQ